MAARSGLRSAKAWTEVSTARTPIAAAISAGVGARAAISIRVGQVFLAAVEDRRDDRAEIAERHLVNGVRTGSGIGSTPSAIDLP
jgi:hypothetical protein